MIQQSKAILTLPIFLFLVTILLADEQFPW